MASHSFYGYSSGALVHDPDVDGLTLHPAYDFRTDRVLFEITEGGSDERGRTGVATKADGTRVASGVLHAEPYRIVQAPDEVRVTIDRIEINGVKIGYVPSLPLEPGVRYICCDADISSGGSEGDDTRTTCGEYDHGNVPCFGPGTMIRTQDGEIPIEWLETSDRVLTRDHGYQPVVWIGRTRLQPGYFARYPHARPVCIPAGACAPDHPTHDLHVTGDHRLLFTSAMAELLYFSNEVLAPARAWADRGRGFQITPERPYTLTHIACTHHEIILAQGVWVETMLPAADTLRRLPEGDAARLTQALGQDGMDQSAARPCVTRSEARLLIDSAADADEQYDDLSFLRSA